MPTAAPESNGEIVELVGGGEIRTVVLPALGFVLNNAARYRLHHVCYEGMHIPILV